MSYGGNGGTGSIHGGSDVTLSNPANGQILTYNGNVQKWQNQVAPITVVTAGGNANTARPSGAIVVYWICNTGVNPANAQAGDLIYQG